MTEKVKIANKTYIIKELSEEKFGSPTYKLISEQGDSLLAEMSPDGNLVSGDKVLNHDRPDLFGYTLDQSAVEGMIWFGYEAHVEKGKGRYTLDWKVHHGIENTHTVTLEYAEVIKALRTKDPKTGAELAACDALCALMLGRLENEQ